ncbi:MAG TPA: alpha/beta fold hydrolase [Thermoanaerobaculia bacterium]|jgi:haloacetate dehalogenase|nr:alpha/beta fold hydrolase [Thermoanaerobaculia bacterium]
MHWHRVAPLLAQQFTVIVPDLPGYGESEGPDEGHERYSKREIGRALVELMQARGFDRFAVAGHDRGGRLAYRMALDHPERISHLAILDVVPTLDMAEGTSHELAMATANWFLLAQAAPFPETLIGQAPEFYLDHILDSWAGTPGALTKEARAEYAQAFRQPSFCMPCARTTAPARASIWSMTGRTAMRGGESAARCSCCGAPRARQENTSIRSPSGGDGRPTFRAGRSIAVTF